jgi:hypothetical protein
VALDSPSAPFAALAPQCCVGLYVGSALRVATRLHLCCAWLYIGARLQFIIHRHLCCTWHYIGAGRRCFVLGSSGAVLLGSPHQSLCCAWYSLSCAGLSIGAWTALGSTLALGFLWCHNSAGSVLGSVLMVARRWVPHRPLLLPMAHCRVWIYIGDVLCMTLGTLVHVLRRALHRGYAVLDSTPAFVLHLALHWHWPALGCAGFYWRTGR